MKHTRIARAIAIALALAIAGTALAAPHAFAAPKAAAKTTSRTARKGTTLHQFSGTVTAMDASSLTVEKGGKNPKRMTFDRRADMSTTGAVERDARVTVYYRDEDGRSVAHRVVAKDATMSPVK
jgi:YD repeat-containing protein